jgi:tetratricopeptide (TPR) repeat protein
MQIARMKRRQDEGPRVEAQEFIARNSHLVRRSSASGTGRRLAGVLGAIAVLTSLSMPARAAQQGSPQRSAGFAIHGRVLDRAGKAVADATVRLEEATVSGVEETKSDAAGGFSFLDLRAGSYTLTAEKQGQRSRVSVAIPSPQGGPQQANLVLADSDEAPGAAGATRSSSGPAMEFADTPNFTIAGVTDWTAVGGHGSDSSLRTSEDLARATLTLKPGDAAAGGAERPASNAGPRAAADGHRAAGEEYEKRGDPLAAVHEFEQAARLDASEQNYFEWGSELLLHRAVWQALAVFQKGAESYPQSARMLTALGTALFASARYDEAAQRLCDASDLNPADTAPYLFMGKIEMAAPNPLACIERKLARFAERQPASSLANYLYAMAILKQQEQAPDEQARKDAEALLTKAVTVDSKCADAYLQLGILSAAQRNLEKAIGFYAKAIEANPELSEAHYRLGVAYDRTGETAKARREFELHDAIQKREADAVERQRREVKQFLVVEPGQPAAPAAR